MDDHRFPAGFAERCRPGKDDAGERSRSTGAAADFADASGGAGAAIASRSAHTAAAGGRAPPTARPPHSPAPPAGGAAPAIPPPPPPPAAGGGPARHNDGPGRGPLHRARARTHGTAQEPDAAGRDLLAESEARPAAWSR